jgi:hypothetical protein
VLTNCFVLGFVCQLPIIDMVVWLVVHGMWDGGCSRVTTRRCDANMGKRRELTKGECFVMLLCMFF